MNAWRQGRARGRSSAGWRTIGDRRIYFRSRWEANYARYLDFLRQRKDVVAWGFEEVTFWFEKIRRGVRSYTPDFRVELPCGAIVFLEVKGHMDAKSKTKLARMKRYHPQVELIVIGADDYRYIERWNKTDNEITDWEY